MIAGALLALTLLAYTYFGYPLAIAVLARLFARARAPGAQPLDSLPSVSVFLPVLDGAAYLPAKLDSLLAQDYPRDRLQILIYCDGCRDDSEAVARARAAAPEAAGRIQVLADSRRRGKPTALNLLAAEARGDLLLLNDVRQPLSPNAVRALAEAMSDPEVGYATGKLVLEGAAGSGAYWRYEAWIRGQESRFRGVVGMTGSLAMMWRAHFQPLPEDVILDDVWMPMQLGLRARKRVVLVTEAEARDSAFDDDREFRRKARTLAGNYQLLARMPGLLLPFRNPIWFETVSHKVLRLLAPWLLAALAATSAAAACSGAGGGVTLMRALVAGQLAFYAVAAVGGRAGRLAGLARTFVVLNAAAVVGLWRYLTGNQRVTW